MTTVELIEALKRFDPNTGVKVALTDEESYYTRDIISIEYFIDDNELLIIGLF